MSWFSFLICLPGTGHNIWAIQRGRVSGLLIYLFPCTCFWFISSFLLRLCIFAVYSLSLDYIRFVTVRIIVQKNCDNVTLQSPSHFYPCPKSGIFGLCMSCFVFIFSLFVYDTWVYRDNCFNVPVYNAICFEASCSLSCGMRISCLFIENQWVTFGWHFYSSVVVSFCVLDIGLLID